MNTLTSYQSDLINNLSNVYNLKCIKFTPSFVAGTYTAMDYEQLTNIRETAKESGLMVAINVREKTFAFIA